MPKSKFKEFINIIFIRLPKNSSNQVCEIKLEEKWIFTSDNIELKSKLCEVIITKSIYIII